jgi:hypothetical protein
MPNIRKLLLLTSIIFSSCKKDHLFDCFKGTGDNVTECRYETGFTRVTANNNVDVEIYPGHEYKIEITAGGHLIDGITTTVKDSMLYISNENKCNWVRSFKNKFSAKVWLPQLTELTANGSGDITLLDTIRYDGFTYNNWGASGTVTFLFNTPSAHINIHTGPGDFKMYGYVAVNYLYNNGDGRLDASQLNTDVTFTENKGANYEYVKAKNYLSAKISYVGNIYYYGHPGEVERLGDGSGKLIQAD